MRWVLRWKKRWTRLAHAARRELLRDATVILFERDDNAARGREVAGGR